MNDDELILSTVDFTEFREWLSLDYQAITWQERYKDEFEQFWEMLFIEGISIFQLLERFSYILSRKVCGPLSSWFSWLRNSFIYYVFVKKDISLWEISRYSHIEIAKVASSIRHFLIDQYPHLEQELNLLLQISHNSGKNKDLKFSELKESFGLSDKVEKNLDSQLLSELEVTLYPDWKKVLKQMKKDIYGPHFDFVKAKEKTSFKEQMGLLVKVVLYFTVGIGIVLLTKFFNEKYEKYLISKVEVQAPDYSWNDKTLSFSPIQKRVNTEEINANVKDIENVADAVFDEQDFNEERYSPESEVVLTSWDSLPRDIAVADLEESGYEEKAKRGYREVSYGRTKVYRVMMKSVATSEVSSKLKGLISEYNAEQVDHVRPGTEVPGGLYYNIYVPSKDLKEFLAQVTSLDEAVLYESKTLTERNPPGKNKVFIWLKKI